MEWYFGKAANRPNMVNITWKCFFKRKEDSKILKFNVVLLDVLFECFQNESMKCISIDQN